MQGKPLRGLVSSLSGLNHVPAVVVIAHLFCRAASSLERALALFPQDLSSSSQSRAQEVVASIGSTDRPRCPFGRETADYKMRATKNALLEIYQAAAVDTAWARAAASSTLRPALRPARARALVITAAFEIARAR